MRFLCLCGSILGFSAALGSPVPAAADVAPLNGDLTFTRGGIARIGTEALETPGLERDRIRGSLAARGPAWSPDATRIAFSDEDRRANNRDIYVVGSDGMKPTQRLTGNPAYDAQPSWSPGGEKIVFTSRRDGNPEIYVMTNTGADLRRLTSSPGTDRQPAWSPDGTKIAFASNRGGSLGIWVMNPDGTKAFALTPGVGYATDPEWSPDGKRIAYATGSPRATSIVSTDRRGEDLQPITSGAKGDRYPAWSPDNQQVAFARARANLSPEVMVVAVPSSAPVRGLATVALSSGPKLVTRGTDPDWGVLPKVSDAGAPEVGETTNAEPKGDVTVTVPGAVKSAPLNNARQLPVGTIIDTTKSAVTLDAPVGDRQKTIEAVASGGTFTYKQADKDGADAVLDLRLPPGCQSDNAASMKNTVTLSVDGMVEGQGRVGRAFAARVNPARYVGGTRNGKGKAAGRRPRRLRYLGGASPGTEWTTTYECHRTIFAVQDGVVQVEDTKYGTEVEVPAGRCYVAPSPDPVALQRCE